MRGLKFIPLAALLGLVWFLFLSQKGSEWLTNQLIEADNKGLSIGKIVNAKGSFKLIRGGDSFPHKFSGNAIELLDGDRLETDKNSSLILVLNSQDEFELQELSRINVELWNSRDLNSPIYIHWDLGNLESKEMGIRGKAYVVKDGRLFLPGQKPSNKPLTLTILQHSDLKLSDAQSDFEDAESESDEAIDAKDISSVAETLANEYIDEVILSKQNQFQKCWITRLKENPTLKGQIIVQFEISRRGKVRELKVADATIDDEPLKRCVLSVFERLSFRPYKGQEISLSYPVQFE